MANVADRVKEIIVEKLGVDRPRVPLSARGSASATWHVRAISKNPMHSAVFVSAARLGLMTDHLPLATLYAFPCQSFPCHNPPRSSVFWSRGPWETCGFREPCFPQTTDD